MAQVITVHCAPSGKEEAFELEADTTVREFKRQLHGWLPCGNESQRNMSSVEVVVGDTPLLNDEMVSEAIPGAQVLAFLSIKPVKCTTALSSGCKREDLCVVEITAAAQIVPFAFQNCRSLASVAIPNSVTAIKNSAFAHCSSLKSVAIPDSVTEMGRGVFENCSSLESLTIPSSVTEIQVGAFEHCSSLTSVSIPETVTKIGQRAFRGCSSLPSITIPNSVTKISQQAFENCSSLASVTIPDVTRVGKGAFAGCNFDWVDECTEESEDSSIEFGLFDDLFD